MTLIRLETVDALQEAIDTAQRHGCDAVFLGDERGEADARVVLMVHRSCETPCILPFLYGEDVLQGPVNWPTPAIVENYIAAQDY